MVISLASLLPFPRRASFQRGLYGSGKSGYNILHTEIPLLARFGIQTFSSASLKKYLRSTHPSKTIKLNDPTLDPEHEPVLHPHEPSGLLFIQR